MRQLWAALDQGWQIEAPVYLRHRWGDSGERVYLFLLRRPWHNLRLVTVPEGPAAAHFVQAAGLPVVS